MRSAWLLIDCFLSVVAGHLRKAEVLLYSLGRVQSVMVGRLDGWDPGQMVMLSLQSRSREQMLER